MRNYNCIVVQQSLAKASIASVNEEGFFPLLALQHITSKTCRSPWQTFLLAILLCICSTYVAKADDPQIIKGGKMLVDSGPLIKVKMQTVNIVGEDMCDFWLMWTGAVKAKSVSVNGAAVPLTNKTNGKQHVVFTPCVSNGQKITIQAEFEGNITLLYLIPTDSMHSDLLINLPVNTNAGEANKKIEKTSLPGGTQSPTFASSKFPSLSYTNLTSTDICDLKIEAASLIEEIYINNNKVDSMMVNGVKVPSGQGANSKTVHVYFKCVKPGEAFKVSVKLKDGTNVAEITTYKITPTDSIHADIMVNNKVQDGGTVPQGSSANKTNTSGGKQSPTFGSSSFPRLAYDNATGTAICDMRIEAPAGILIQEVYVNDKKVDSIYANNIKVTAQPANKNVVHVFFPCIADGQGYSMSIKFNKPCTTYVYTPTDSMNADLSCGIQNIHPGDKATRTVKFSGATPGSTFSANKSSTVFKNDTRDTIYDLEIIAKEEISSVEVNGVKWDTKPAGKKNDTIHVYAPAGGEINPNEKLVVTVTCANGKKIDGYTIRFTNNGDNTIYQVACTGGVMNFYIPNDGFAFGATGRKGSVVAINESCNPISELVFTSPHPSIEVTAASSYAPSMYDVPSHTLYFNPPIQPGGDVQFNFETNTLLPYFISDTFPYTTINVAVPGQHVSYDAVAAIVPCSHPSANDGSISISLIGGWSLPMFSWSNGSTTKDLSNVYAGTYTVTVSSANGCMIKSFVVPANPIVNIPNPELTLVSVGPWCANTQDGYAMVMDNLNNSMLPLTYSWSNGSTTAINSALADGVYTVTVSNSKGLMWTSSCTIASPSPFTVSATVSKLRCYNDFSGSISLVPSGGNSPYQYIWNNGNTVQIRTGLKAGVYTVAASDAHGCSVVNSYQVKQPLLLQMTSYTSHVTCFGGNNGTASVIATGGTKPYSYQWSNGATTIGVNNLAAGIYNVMVTDVKGCVSNSTINISSPPPLQINIQPMSPNQAFANVIGGVPPYQITWNTLPPQLGPLATGLFPGQTVQVQVADNAGCVQMLMFTMPPMKAPHKFIDQHKMLCLAYPNPASDAVTLHFDGIENEKIIITILDFAGKQVLSKHNTIHYGTDIVLNIKHLTNGLYTIAIQSQTETHKIKLSVHN